MTTIELTESLEDERLAPILPLIAEVWRDGEPSDLEVAAICLEVLMSRRSLSARKRSHVGWIGANLLLRRIWRASGHMSQVAPRRPAPRPIAWKGRRATNRLG